MYSDSEWDPWELANHQCLFILLHQLNDMALTNKKAKWAFDFMQSVHSVMRKENAQHYKNNKDKLDKIQKLYKYYSNKIAKEIL